MKILLSVLGTIVFFLLIGLIIMYTGIVNVSVLDPPSGLTKWVLSTTMESSVESRADDTAVPDLENEEMIREGAEHYIAMCEGCHGAPGLETSELARGLEPVPPHLYEKDEAEELNPAEDFWVTKNGIMMTGMPAWGVTHSDEAIWNIVAFMQKLPDMSAEEYRTLAEEIESGSMIEENHGESEGHNHEGHEH